MELHRGEVDIQVATAKRWPRDPARWLAEARALLCTDAETAASAFYALPRGGKILTGPSIRMAEVLVYAMGNMRAEKRILENDGKVVRSQGLAWDMERNNAIRTEVARRITDKSGRTFTEDMIVVTGMAAASIAMRNAIVHVVPSYYVQALLRDVMTRAASKEEKETRDEQVRRLLDWWGRRGVSEEQALALVDCAALAELGDEELAHLRGLATALRDGEVTLETILQELPTANAAPAAPRAEEGRRGFASKRRQQQNTGGGK